MDTDNPAGWLCTNGIAAQEMTHPTKQPDHKARCPWNIPGERALFISPTILELLNKLRAEHGEPPVQVREQPNGTFRIIRTA
jgi:hypothetical protein